jgi:hypothetical protein
VVTDILAIIPAIESPTVIEAGNTIVVPFGTIIATTVAGLLPMQDLVECFAVVLCVMASVSVALLRGVIVTQFIKHGVGDNLYDKGRAFMYVKRDAIRRVIFFLQTAGIIMTQVGLLLLPNRWSE